MEIRTIGIIGQGALGVMYGNHLTKKLGNEHVFLSRTKRVWNDTARRA